MQSWKINYCTENMLTTILSPGTAKRHLQGKGTNYSSMG